MARGNVHYFKEQVDTLGLCLATDARILLHSSPLLLFQMAKPGEKNLYHNHIEEEGDKHFSPNS